MVESTKLEVWLGQYRLILEFIVCESLTAAFIIGSDFCDRFFIDMMPQNRKVELTDETNVPIVRDPDDAYRSDPKVAIRDPSEEGQVNRASVATRAAEEKLLPNHIQTLVLFQGKGKENMVLKPEP